MLEIHSNSLTLWMLPSTHVLCMYIYIKFFVCFKCKYVYMLVGTWLHQALASQLYTFKEYSLLYQIFI